MAIGGCYLVKLSFYDDAQRSPVLLRVNKDTTAGQLYNKGAGEANIKSKFQLFYFDESDNLIENCDRPLSQIFQGDEVDVQLVVTVDGGSGSQLKSLCVNCSAAGSDNRTCGECNNLTDEIIIGDIVADREDAWSVLCKAFNISMDVRQQIEENSYDPGVRCIDAMHRIYHSNTSLTWDDVQAKVKSYDPHLGKLISECKY